MWKFPESPFGLDFTVLAKRQNFGSVLWNLGIISLIFIGVGGWFSSYRGPTTDDRSLNWKGSEKAGRSLIWGTLSLHLECVAQERHGGGGESYSCPNLNRWPSEYEDGSYSLEYDFDVQSFSKAVTTVHYCQGLTCHVADSEKGSQTCRLTGNVNWVSSNCRPTHDNWLHT